jgi:hypothetical protein
VSEDQVRRKWRFEAAHPEVSIRSARDEVGRIFFYADRPGRERIRGSELSDVLDTLEAEAAGR